MTKLVNKLGAAFFFCVAASAADGQRNNDVTLVLSATARAVRANLPSGVVTLDPRVAKAGQYMDEAARDARPNHAAATLSAIKQVLGGNVAKVEDVVVCTQNRPGSCGLSQGVAVLALGEPIFNGDTATVVVYAMVPTGSTRQAFAEREMRVVLVRDKQSWRVMESKVVRIS